MKASNLATLILANFLINYCYGNNRTIDDNCKTPGCLSAANGTKFDMNMQLDPCESFYEFACGGFEEKVQTPLVEVFKNQFTLLNMTKEEELKHFTVTPLGSEWPDSLHKGNQYYNVCMSDRAVGNKSISDIKMFLSKLEVWPIFTQNWNDSQFDEVKYFRAVWQEGIIGNEMINVQFYKAYAYQIIKLRLPQTFLDKNCTQQGFLCDDVVKYYNFMVNLSVLLGAERSVAEIDMREVMNLEINISKAMVDEDNDVDSEYIGDLEQKYLNIPILELLQAFFGPFYDLTLNSSIIIPAYKYYEELNNMTATLSKRTFANFLYWSTIRTIGEFGDRDVIDPDRTVYTWTNESEECIRETLRFFGYDIGLIRYLTILPRNVKKEVNQQLEVIKSILVWMADNATWLDNKTSATAKEFYEMITFKTGYPDEAVDDTALANLNNGLNVTEDFFNTSTFLLVYRRIEILIEFGSDNVSIWDEDPNSGLTPRYIEPNLLLPVNIFQPSMFSGDFPAPLKLGFYGGEIATQMGRDRYYGLHGNMLNFNRYNNKNDTKQRILCQIDQLSKMNDTKRNQSVDGEWAIQIYVPSLAGMMATYKSFINMSLNNTEPWELPGFNYTRRQWFWLQAARTGCTVYSKKYLSRYTPDFPSYLLVDSVLRDIREFSEDWNCPAHSRMNHGNPCGIWGEGNSSYYSNRPVPIIPLA